MTLPIFQTFIPTAAKWDIATVRVTYQILVNDQTGAPLGFVNPSATGPQGVWVPTPLTAEQIASPIAEILADLNATFQADTAPYTRYYSDGEQLVSIGGSSGSLAVGSTAITSGTTAAILWNNAGVLANGAATTTAAGDITLPAAQHFTVGQATNAAHDSVAPFCQFGGYGGLSAPNWFGRGVQLDFPAQTYLDTTTTTDINSVYLSNWGQSSIAFTVPVTVARAAMLKINGLSAGANATIIDNYCINTSDGNNQFENFSAFGSVSPTARVHIGSDVTQASWTTNQALNFLITNGTLTDNSTAALSTITTRSASALNTPSFAFSLGASTISDGYNLAINDAAAAGTNATITRAWALGVRGGTNSRFGENATIASTLGTSAMGYVTVVSASGGGGGTAVPKGILLQDTSSGNSWDLVSPFAVLDFGSNDTNTLGAGTRARLGAVMEATAGAGARLSLFTAPATAGTLVERLAVTSLGNIVIGTAALATNATDGFLYIPSCAGTPTGTPTAYTGRLPIIIDSSANKLYFYSSGAWRDAGP